MNARASLRRAASDGGKSAVEGIWLPGKAWRFVRQGQRAMADTLGPITEQRFLEAFSEAALVSAKVAAKLVGLDPDTLSDMADAGVIRAVRKGRLRSYTEHALRDYLLRGPDAPSRERKTERAETVRRVRVVPFSRRDAAAHR